MVEYNRLKDGTITFHYKDKPIEFDPNDIVKTAEDQMDLIEVGEYYRTKYNINQLKPNVYVFDNIYKVSKDILDLLEPMDLMFIDIDNGCEGGIIVPRMVETENELKGYIDNFRDGTYILKGVLNREHILRDTYWLGGVKDAN